MTREDGQRPAECETSAGALAHDRGGQKRGQKEGYFLIQGNKVGAARNHYAFSEGKTHAG
jgi:hypothetical protein